MVDRLMLYIKNSWEKKSKIYYILYPLSIIYLLFIKIRKILYAKGFIYRYKFPVPIIVVGNITVGGNGKTPIVIEIANYLKKHKLSPGIVSRGYKSNCNIYPSFVDSTCDAKIMGDEPVLIANKTKLPVIIDPNRVRGINNLINNYNCNVVILDDGLQHYSLIPYIKILTQINNNSENLSIIPAGPYRDTFDTLDDSNFILLDSKPLQTDKNIHKTYQVKRNIKSAINLVSGEERLIKDFSNNNISVYTSIANPNLFISQLRKKITINSFKSYPDHYVFSSRDLICSPNEIIFMTEKDAIKCKSFRNKQIWFVPLECKIEKEFLVKLKEMIFLWNY